MMPAQDLEPSRSFLRPTEPAPKHHIVLPEPFCLPCHLRPLSPRTMWHGSWRRVYSGRWRWSQVLLGEPGQLASRCEHLTSCCRGHWLWPGSQFPCMLARSCDTQRCLGAARWVSYTCTLDGQACQGVNAQAQSTTGEGCGVAGTQPASLLLSGIVDGSCGTEPPMPITGPV